MRKFSFLLISLLMGCTHGGDRRVANEDSDPARKQRICDAMGKVSELNGLSAKYAKQVGEVLPGIEIPAGEDPVQDMVGGLSQAQLDKLYPHVCGWFFENNIRVTEIKRAYTRDVMNLTQDRDAGDAASYLMINADLGEVPSAYCMGARDQLKKTPLRGNPKRNAEQLAVAMLVHSIKLRESSGQNYADITWQGFEKAYGITTASCR